MPCFYSCLVSRQGFKYFQTLCFPSSFLFLHPISLMLSPPRCPLLLTKLPGARISLLHVRRDKTACSHHRCEQLVFKHVKKILWLERSPPNYKLDVVSSLNNVSKAVNLSDEFDRVKAHLEVKKTWTAEPQVSDKSRPLPSLVQQVAPQTYKEPQRFSSISWYIRFLLKHPVLLPGAPWWERIFSRICFMSQNASS